MARISKTDEKMVVVISDVRRAVADRRGIEVSSDKLEKESTLRGIMVKEGLHERPRTAVKEERMLVGRERTYVLANFPIHESAKWEDLKEHRRTPDDLAVI
jgi:hypothetical protein